MEISSDKPSSFKTQRNSPAIRIWHWLTFIGFSASLMTVLLGSTLFKSDSNISSTMEAADRKGVQIGREAAREIAGEYNDQFWHAHRIIGFILCFLFLSRIFIEISQNKTEKLSYRIRTALSLKPANTNAASERDHYVLVKRGYLVFYVLFGLMALTGLAMAFEDLPFLKPFHKSARSIHSFVQYGIYAYILLHITGVIRADLYKNRGIISGMINGGS